MSLFDLILSGAKVTNLDGTEANIEALDTDGAEVDTAEENEADTVETTEDSSGDEVVKTEELDTELLEVQDDVEEVNEAEQDVEEVEDAVVATESFLANLFAAKAMGGLTAVHGELACEHINYISNRLNVPSEMIPAIDYGVESYSTVGGVAMNTEGAIESVKEFFIKLIDAILKGIAWLVDKGREVISKLFNNFEKMKKYAEEVKKIVQKIEGNGILKEPSEKTYKNASHANALTVNGKVESITTCVQVLDSVTKEIASKWNITKIEKSSEVVSVDLEGRLKEIDSNGNKEFGDGYTSAFESDSRHETRKAYRTTYNETSVSGTQDDADRIGAYANSGVQAMKGKSQEMIRLMAESIRESHGALPYSNGKKASSNEAKKAGIKLKEHEECFMSPVLPRNKVIVVVRSDASKAVNEKNVHNRLYTKLTSYKPETSNVQLNITPENKSNLNSAISTIINVIELMSKVKKLIDASSNAAKKLNGVIWRLRTKYIAISKKAREGRGVMENIRFTRQSILVIKDLINLLREPGTSFSTYMLFEVNSLLGIIKYQASLYKHTVSK